MVVNVGESAGKQLGVCRMSVISPLLEFQMSLDVKTRTVLLRINHTHSAQIQLSMPFKLHTYASDELLTLM